MKAFALVPIKNPDHFNTGIAHQPRLATLQNCRKYCKKMGGDYGDNRGR